MNIFKTQRFTAAILAAVFSLSLSNCAIRVGTTNNSVKTKKVPPGQAKKMTGSKSAKNYAPGQNK